MIPYQHLVYPERPGLPIMLIPFGGKGREISFKASKDLILGALLRGEGVFLSDRKEGLNIIAFFDRKEIEKAEMNFNELEKRAAQK